MSFKINPYLIVVFVLALCFGLFYCNGKGERDILNKVKSNLEIENKKILFEKNRLEIEHQSYKDSISLISKRRDTIYKTLTKYRDISSKSIREAKNGSEKLSEEKVWNRFSNYNDIWVFSEVSDSVSRELVVNKKLMQESALEIDFLNESVSKLESIVINRDKLINSKNIEIDFNQDQQKLTRKRWFKIGLITGGVVTAGGIVVARNLIKK